MTIPTPGTPGATSAPDSGLSWPKRVGIVLIALAVAFSLFAGIWALTVQQNQINSLSTQVEQQNPVDGELDYSTALFDAATDEIARQSIRNAVFRYVDADGNYVGSQVVTAVILSDKYVMVPAQVILPPESGLTIAAAGIQASDLDLDPTAVEEIDLSVQPIPEVALGVLVFKRSADIVLSAVPITETLGKVTELRTNMSLVAPGTLPVNTQAPNEFGVQLVGVGKVDIIVGGRIITTGVAAGLPVYALRDGVPELVGISVYFDGTFSSVVPIFELQPLFEQLGIDVEFPQ